MKEWFVKEAEGLIYEGKQLSLFESMDDKPKVGPKNGGDK